MQWLLSALFYLFIYLFISISNEPFNYLIILSENVFFLSCLIFTVSGNFNFQEELGL